MFVKTRETSMVKQKKNWHCGHDSCQWQLHPKDPTLVSWTATTRILWTWTCLHTSCWSSDHQRELLQVYSAACLSLSLTVLTMVTVLQNDVFVSNDHDPARLECLFLGGHKDDDELSCAQRSSQANLFIQTIAGESLYQIKCISPCIY